jgi:hypothetical protein
MMPITINATTAITIQRMPAVALGSSSDRGKNPLSQLKNCLIFSPIHSNMRPIDRAMRSISGTSGI